MFVRVAVLAKAGVKNDKFAKAIVLFWNNSDARNMWPCTFV